MKIGAIFPTTEIGSDPAAVKDWAQTAEALGFSHIITYDHVLGVEHAGRDPKLTGPYTEDNPDRLYHHRDWLYYEEKPMYIDL